MSEKAASLSKNSLPSIENAVIDIMMKGKALTLDELASELKINREALKKILDILVIKGVLVERELKSGCDLNCSSCPLRKVCPYKSLGIKLVYYELRKKE